MRMTPARIRGFMSVWPPFVGAGIRVREVSPDGTRVVVTHKPRLLTRNAVGTAFGGTILAMTDPFYMLSAMTRLGSDYIVWDTGVEAQFRKPGRGLLTADMRIDDATYELIRERTAGGEKYLHWFDVDVTDESGDVVATVRRQVYFRRKKDRAA